MHPPGEWVQSLGDDNAWHEHQLAESPLPTRRELDRIVTDQPVFLLRGTRCRRAQLTCYRRSSAADPRLTGVELDTETGSPAGVRHPTPPGRLRHPEPWRQLEILEAGVSTALEVRHHGSCRSGLARSF